EGFKRNFAGTGKKFPTWVEIVGKPARDARWPDRIEVARDLSIMGGGHGQGTDHSQADHSGLSELPLGGRGVRQSHVPRGPERIGEEQPGRCSDFLERSDEDAALVGDRVAGRRRGVPWARANGRSQDASNVGTWSRAGTDRRRGRVRTLCV